ncbi:MAG TPA: GNAT family N-acetyltransferase [Acidimicrobiales bacterium]|nr:GNAT family N-acetyltransferase [Acidimicrobiales bacterium]
MVQVRRARDDDAAAVAAVHVRSWQVGYGGLLPADYLDGLRPEDRMGRYRFGATDADAPVTLVATEGDVICGFATTGPSPDAETAGCGEVLALYVDPGAWGRGVGRRLICDARTALVGRGFGDAVLWVLVGNARAERFYVADGWGADGGRRRQEIWGVAVDEVRYRRAVP